MAKKSKIKNKDEMQAYLQFLKAVDSKIDDTYTKVFDNLNSFTNTPSIDQSYLKTESVKQSIQNNISVVQIINQQNDLSEKSKKKDKADKNDVAKETKPTDEPIADLVGDVPTNRKFSFNNFFQKHPMFLNVILIPLVLLLIGVACTIYITGVNDDIKDLKSGIRDIQVKYANIESNSKTNLTDINMLKLEFNKDIELLNYKIDQFYRNPKKIID